MESQRLEGLRSELLVLCDKAKRGIESPEGSEVPPRSPKQLADVLHTLGSPPELTQP